MDLANSYYLWFLPDEPFFSQYHQIISSLSTQYKTPVFEPHVTLVSGLSAPEDILIESIARFAKEHTKLEFTFHEIDYTHGFFTALFLRAHLTAKAKQTNQEAKQLLNPFGQTAYDPHMSLLYGNITEHEKKSIIEELDFKETRVTFSRLQLVQGNADVAQWRTCGQWNLGQ